MRRRARAVITVVQNAAPPERDASTFASLYRSEERRANELQELLDKTEDTYSELMRRMAARASELRRSLKFADTHVPRWEGIIAEHKVEIERLEQNEDFLERAVHALLGCCDGSDVPCEVRDAEALYEHVRHGMPHRTFKAVAAEVERLRELWPLNGLGGDTDVQQLIANQRAWTQTAGERATAATALADELLAMFATGEKGHPGKPYVRTGWIDEATITRLRERRAALESSVESPNHQANQHWPAPAVEGNPDR
ncbi:hypothetical protein [Lentzea sp. NPDC092896]|uniref:hypothetical protein n=1 Tax=Lentzea sp. NPDC092896 TaxID=3364127 RepID=UPI00380A632B